MVDLADFWVARLFSLFHNLRLLTENVNDAGIYFRWFETTALYAALGAGGATVLSSPAGYGFARLRFRGSRA